MKNTKNMDVQTYNELKQLIQDSHNTQGRKSALMQKVHDVYHFGQNKHLKIAIKDPKGFMMNRLML
jgi:hypothetical protein